MRSALIVADYSHHHSHWLSKTSLSEWLIEENIPALYGIDTRMLTKKLRDGGASLATVTFNETTMAPKTTKTTTTTTTTMTTTATCLSLTEFDDYCGRQMPDSRQSAP